MELDYSFRELVHDHHGRDHGGKRVAMVLEQQLRVYILIFSQEAENKAGPGVEFWNFKAYTQWHNSSNKVTSPNPSKTVLPTGNKLYEPVGANLIQTSMDGW